MNAVSVVFLLAVISFCEGSAIFPSPHNLAVQSLNTQYILKWQWEPQTPPSQSVTFTAQYLHKFKIKRKKQDWKSVCNATLDTQCDFSLAQLHYQGTYVFRVKADCAGESSEWAQTEFCPDQDANLGPPSKLQVFRGNGLLRILISDPLNSNNKSMREILLPSLYFYIQYWKHSENLVEGSQFLTTSNNDVTLVDLQSWTTYCVRVRCHFDFYNKTSHFSPVVCVKIEGQIPIWLVILASCLVLAALTFGLYRCIPLFKSTFFPSTQLPASMYLCTAEPGLDLSHLLAIEAQVDVFCEKLEVHPKVVPPEMPPLPHSPGHSHEGSCDSGMYSNGEGSGEQGGAPDWTGGSDLLGVISESMGVASGQTGVATKQGNPAESGVDSGIGRMVAV
ncbi:interferon alpha/beta receptor 1a-like [Conger conger]|uniref:interferon alpha/beta receptor 1a-like n=1 Tax=Conger conger TaxID=82655 RepID=UPI002A5AD9E3|nr:interferon alpha/beta receptor 1a-like [Conger conger]